MPPADGESADARNGLRASPCDGSPCLSGVEPADLRGCRRTSRRQFARRNRPTGCTAPLIILDFLFSENSQAVLEVLRFTRLFTSRYRLPYLTPCLTPCKQEGQTAGTSDIRIGHRDIPGGGGPSQYYPVITDSRRHAFRHPSRRHPGRRHPAAFIPQKNKLILCVAIRRKKELCKSGKILAKVILLAGLY